MNNNIDYKIGMAENYLKNSDYSYCPPNRELNLSNSNIKINFVCNYKMS